MNRNRRHWIRVTLVAVGLLILAGVSRAATVSIVQSGTAVSNDDGTLTVTLGQAVDPSTSVLFFSTRHSDPQPGNAMVRGRLANATTVEFIRATDDSEPLPISWYVVEFASGVRVQRGQVTQNNNTLDVSLAQPVASTQQAFLLYSKTPVAGDNEWGSNDPIGGYIRNTSSLRFRTDAAGGHIIDYQVVEFTDPADVLVQSGETNVNNNTTAVNVNLPQDVNSSNTIVLAGHTINNHSDDYDDRLFRSEVVDSDTVRFTRETTGNDVGRIMWQVVEFRDGTQVQHGIADFPYIFPFVFTSSVSVPLPQEVDRTRSVAFSGMQSAGGQSMGSTEGSSLADYPGISSFTFDLPADDVLEITRNAGFGAAKVGWFVLGFNPAPTGPPPAVLDVAMNELSWKGTMGEVADEVAGNDGTAQGGAGTLGADPAIAGSPGTCRYGDFDGNDDYLAFADASHLDHSDDLTVAIWINTRSIPGSGLKSIVSKDTNYEFHVNDTGSIYWWWNDSNGNVRSFAGGSVSEDTWHHVAITYASGSQIIYLDGVAVAKASFNGTLATNNVELQVGQDQGIAERFWDGHLDELKIYDQVLDPLEIQLVMDATRPCPAQPVGDWHFDEPGWNGTVNEVLDYSGNDHHGTAFNTVTDSGLVCNAADLGAGGTGDYLRLDHAAFDGLDDFTLAVWYRGTQSTGMSLVSAANAPSWNELLYFFVNPGRFDPHLHNSNSGGTIAPPTAINDGNWHFLVWTREGTQNCLYVDDAAAGCRTRPGGAVDIESVIVGQEQDSLGGGFVSNQAVEGDLDELLLFDSALSPGDLATIRANHLSGLNWDGAPRDCPVSGVAGFVINHDGAGIHCLSENVTVTAVDAGSAVVSGYAGEVTLNTGTGRGSWSVATGNGFLDDDTPDDGVATYLFDPADGGTATFALSYPEGAAQVNVDVHQSDDVTLRDDDLEGVLEFAPSGLLMTASPVPNPPPATVNDPIPTQRAGQNFTVYLTAYGVPEDPDNPEQAQQCGVIESYGSNRLLTFTQGYDDPDSGTRVATIGGAPANTGTPQSVAFAAGKASVAVRYKDAGSIDLGVEDAGSFPNTLSGGSNAFVVQPYQLVISRVQSAGGSNNPGATTATGLGFVPAGEAFEVDVEAHDLQGEVTPNYGQETTPESVRLTLTSVDVPAAGAGTLGNGAAFAGSGVPGRFTNTSVLFDDVGVIRITPEVADADFLGTGSVPGLSSGAVGRFHPAYFDLAAAGVTPGCGTFTYMDQPALDLQYTLQALNTAGNVTQNYDATLLGGAPAVADVSHVAEAADDGVDRGGRLSAVGGSWVAGRRTVIQPNLSFARIAAPDGPFDPLRLGVRVTDILDGRPLLGLDLNPATTGNCVAAGNCSARTLGGTTRVVYGRLAVLPTSGPENENLALPLAAQMFTGAAFEHNPADACSTYVAGGLALGSFTGNLASGETSAIAPLAAATLSNGAADSANPPLLAAPGFGNDGSVDVTLDVDTWLEFDWLGSGATDPAATAAFGRFRGHDRIIYWSEPR